MKLIPFLLVLITLFSSEPHLENILLDDPIIKSYEIPFPDFNNPHNPSIIPYEDGYLLSFRSLSRFPEWMQESRLLATNSLVVLVHLDKEFRVKKKSLQILEIKSFSEAFTIYAEDARLFTFQGRVFVLFNDFPSPSPEYMRRLYLVEITRDQGKWVTTKKAVPLIFDEMHRIEKNWVPFVVDQSLYLIYGENPHTILECDPMTGLCKKIDERFIDLDWSYGTIRGGTPALKIDNQFLTFFHSSIENEEIYERRVYFMGAYTFDPSFPFTIQKISPPLGNLEFYKETSSKNHGSKKVVFPGGFVREGNLIHIAWGKDDKMVMITTLDLEKLLKSMK